MTSYIIPEKLRRVLIGALLIAIAGTSDQCSACSGDWPQILGPNRNGVAVYEQLLDTWPADGPQLLWRHAVGSGYAGPVVADGKVIVFHRLGNKLAAEALDAETGRAIWKTNGPATYRSGGIDSDTGPKCVPLVHKNKVYLFDTSGQLTCLKLDNGKLEWTRDLSADLRAPPGFFGAGSTPIVADGKLLVNAGGQQAGIVALELDSGKTVWKSTDERASYSSPILIERNDEPVVVFVTRLQLMGINPVNGDELFSLPFGKRGATVNGAMPVFVNGHLFLTSSYNVGARWVNLAVDPPAVVWSNDSSFSSQYSTPVYYDGHLYGSAGREDQRNGSYRCIDPKTGKVVWERKGFAVGHSILVGQKLLVLDSNGGLHVLAATAQRFQSLLTTRLFDEKSRALPALSNGRLFARSNFERGSATLVCVQVGQQ